jgi:hypothetical protein
MTTRKPRLARKPRLDWIKEVLADLADDSETDASPSGIVWRSAAASAEFQSEDDRPPAPEDDERWFCPSWQQVLLAAMPRT